MSYDGIEGFQVKLARKRLEDHTLHREKRDLTITLSQLETALGCFMIIPR